MLAIGIIVSLTSVVPLYKQSQTYIDRLHYAYAGAQSQAIHYQILRYQDIASQFASRTEIRYRLELLNRGEIDLQNARAFSEPRLADAIRITPDVVASLRLSRQGEIVSQHVFTAEPNLQRFLETSLTSFRLDQIEFYPATDSDTVTMKDLLISVPAPIRDDEGELIGTDLLAFSTVGFHAIANQLTKFGSQMQLFVIRGSGDRVFHVNTPNLDDETVIEIITGSDLPFPTSVLMAGVLTPTVYQNGDSHTLFLVGIPNSDWQLVISAANAELYKEHYTTIILVSAVLFIAIIFGVWAVRRTIRPVINDLTELGNELTLKNRQLELAGQVVDHTHEAIVITDVDLNIQRANQAFLRLIGMLNQPIQGMHLKDLMLIEKLPIQLEQKISRTLQLKNTWQGELWYQARDGRSIPALQSISTIRDNQGQIVQLIHIFNDITQQKITENLILRKAETDQLTGLVNRDGLLKGLQQRVAALQHEETIAVLFLDLDKFKPVNDTYGHQIGDTLLQAVAARLLDLVRKSDLVARPGGDEFVVVLQGPAVHQRATQLANDIVSKLGEPFAVEELRIHVGASVGVAFYPEHAATADELLKQADMAMYAAKQAGRNCVQIADASG
ncbi:MAG: diguanylate cyclase [Aliidiomarina sp.]|uniref:diguanylate cyclase domain-containing protein n=1 Tax=Aliidiomarina sp. TaxID=1872439 RepID=UPI0025C62A5F|nr:diguanylate cyclase [Aliidiomarina sp.]MCH8501807.1 diguanylate cyclase [Aliidiomarina sp.]